MASGKDSPNVDGSLDEHSPLIRPEDAEHDGDVERRPSSDYLELEDSFVGSKSSFYLILLTLSIGGLQIVWSVEMSNGSPYLLSLGMSKALMAFVWLAGPLTGVLVQPYVGIKSDQCRVSWGKRKPFMIAGALGTVGSSMILAYAKEIIWVFGGMQAEAKYQGVYKVATIVLATVMMWVLDFSINTVQAAIRAFIVDGAPAHQQESANAWASRMTGIGNVIGYLFGYLDLPKHFHFLGNTQFKVLVVIASIALSSTVFISSVTIKERNPQLEPASKSEYGSQGLLAFFKQVFVSIRRLPPQIRKVCEIQFCHWIGWFPFLFYVTTYIGQLYVNPYLTPDMTDDEVDKLWDKATRVGTFALLLYAVASFSSNIVLPFLVVPTYKPPIPDDHDDTAQHIVPSSPVGSRRRSASYSEVAHSRTYSNSSGFLSRIGSHKSGSSTGTPSTLQRYLTAIQIPGLTLRRAWMLAQLFFALCMFSTFFITTPTAATIMVGLVGISWSLTLWAPFALISAEIATRDELRRQRKRRKLQDAGAGMSDDVEEEEDQAGIILGLHNVAVSAPQIFATLLSSVVFKILQKDRRTPGDTSVAWTLRIGGVAALVSAFITWRMKEHGEDADRRQYRGNSTTTTRN